MFLAKDYSFCFFSFAFSALLSSLIFPKLKSIGIYLGWTDKPSERKQHKHPLVHIGGLGMILTFLVIINFSFYHLGLDFDYKFFTLLIGSIYFFLIGFIDDLFSLSPFLRLFFQLIASSFLWNFGLKVSVIDLAWINSSLDLILLPDSLSLFLTILLIMGAMNAINWLDGLDGLAAGSVLISSFGLAIMFFLNNNFEGIILSSILSGVCLGFLRYNFYPAKIIMGDGGSYFLGFFLIYLVILFPLINNNQDASNIFLPLLMIVFPIFDMALVMISRLAKKKSIFLPDRSHFHHRLLELGISHKNSVFIIYSIIFWSVCFALLFTNLTNKNILFFISNIILILVFWKKFKFKKSDKKIR